jgi:hypothetical protein
MMPILDPKHEAAINARYPIFLVLWIAFVASPVIFAALVWSGVLKVTGTPSVPAVVGIALAVYAAVILAVSLWLRYGLLPRMALSGGDSVEQVLLRYQNGLVVAFALAESSAIVGIVLMFLGSGPKVYLGFIFASLVVILLEGPRKPEIARLIDEVRRRHP